MLSGTSLLKYTAQFEIDTGLHITLITNRLVLTSFTDVDAKECSALFKNPLVMKTYGDGRPWEEKAIKKWLKEWKNQWKNHEPLSLFMIRKKDSRECVGVIGFW